jgi:ABC-type uncharacterized transport system substrate-binding protein
LRGRRYLRRDVHFSSAQFTSGYKVELVVNLKTAKALGVTIPPAIMVRANRVVQ